MVQTTEDLQEGTPAASVPDGGHVETLQNRRRSAAGKGLDRLPFEEARAMVRRLDLRSAYPLCKASTAWSYWRRKNPERRRELRLPSEPDKAYAKEEGFDWDDFVGGGVVCTCPTATVRLPLKARQQQQQQHNQQLRPPLAVFGLGSRLGSSSFAFPVLAKEDAATDEEAASPPLNVQKQPEPQSAPASRNSERQRRKSPGGMNMEEGVLDGEEKHVEVDTAAAVSGGDTGARLEGRRSSAGKGLDRLPFEEARAMVRRLDLRSAYPLCKASTAWSYWRRKNPERRRELRLPSEPDKAYTKEEGFDWDDFMGSGGAEVVMEATEEPAMEAMEAVMGPEDGGSMASGGQGPQMNEKASEEQREEPPAASSVPDEGPQQQKGRRKKSIDWLPFEEARAFVWTLDLRSVYPSNAARTAWEKWYLANRNRRLELRLPTNPGSVYANEKGFDWDDFVFGSTEKGEASGAASNPGKLTRKRPRQQEDSGDKEPQESPERPRRRSGSANKTSVTSAGAELPRQLYKTYDIKGQVAIVTGASSGIGEAIAWRLAEAGVSLVVTARREERLQKLKADLEAKYGVPVYVQKLDMRDLDAIKALPTTLPAEFQKVDILINNAGLALGVEPAHKSSLEDNITMLETNVTGLMAMTRAFAPGMVERKRGHILNMSSVAGVEGYVGGSGYNASKFAVNGYTIALRHDLNGTPIRVTTISPGAVETEFSIVRMGDKSKADAVYDGFDPLTAADIADNTMYALTRPEHVQIADILVLPRSSLEPQTIAKHTD